MGFWGIPSEIVVGDEYSEVVEKHIQAAARELVEKYPGTEKAQFLATVKMACRHVTVYDDALPPQAVERRNESFEHTVWRSRGEIINGWTERYPLEARRPLRLDVNPRNQDRSGIVIGGMCHSCLHWDQAADSGPLFGNCAKIRVNNKMATMHRLFTCAHWEARS